MQSPNEAEATRAHSQPLVLFRTRLGLAVIDLAGSIARPNVAQAAGRLLREVVVAGDGYAARDVRSLRDSWRSVSGRPPATVW
jgi:hypothetical protein